MKLPYQDKPPSRRVVDRYGIFGILFMLLEVALIMFVSAILAIGVGAQWLWRKLTNKEEGNDKAQADEEA